MNKWKNYWIKILNKKEIIFSKKDDIKKPFKKNKNENSCLREIIFIPKNVM